MHAADTAMPKGLLSFIWQYLRNKKFHLFGYTIVAIISALYISLGPYLLKVMIDIVIKYSNNPVQIIPMITMPAIFYVSLPMILNFNMRIYQYINLSLFPAIKSTIGKDVFSYLLHHSQAFFQNTFAGNLTKKLGDLSERATELISIFIE